MCYKKKMLKFFPVYEKLEKKHTNVISLFIILKPEKVFDCYFPPDIVVFIKNTIAHYLLNNTKQVRS